MTYRESVEIIEDYTRELEKMVERGENFTLPLIKLNYLRRL